jgi:hypothetical protein
MNRKILAGAAASLMLTSLPVAITSAGAAGLPKPTIASVTVTHDANHQYLSSSQIGVNETVDVVISGTGFNNGSYTAASLAVKSTPEVTVNSVSRVNSTTVNATVHTGIGIGAVKQNKAAAFTLTVPTGGASAGGSAKLKTGPTVVSNCGYSFPLAQAGKTYAEVDNSLVINTDGSNFTGTNAAVTYFDVNLLGTNPLCSPDVLAPTSVPTTTPVWALNYPINMSGAYGENLTTDKKSANFTIGKVRNIGFSFPYTTAQTLDVIGSVTTYKVVGAKSVAGCAADTANTISISSCVATPKSIVVTSTANRTYHQGDTIQSPIVKLTGVGLKSSPIQLIPVSNISTISLAGGAHLDITFAPRAKTANATYAPISIAQN